MDDNFNALHEMLGMAPITEKAKKREINQKRRIARGMIEGLLYTMEKAGLVVF